MDTFQMYGLKRCSTCVKAREWLAAQGLDSTFTDYRDTPVSADRLQGWADAAGGWPALVNRSSTTWRTLSDEQKQADDDAQWLALVTAYPALVRRPVLVRGDGALLLGFSEARYADFIAGSAAC